MYKRLMDSFLLIILFCSSSLANDVGTKQKEMLYTAVSVQTHTGYGTGIVIDKLDTQKSGVFEYRVLSNAHITHSRLIARIVGVDFITGVIDKEIIDTGCLVVAFDHANKTGFRYMAKIIVEDKRLDLAILSFESSRELSVAKRASMDVLNSVRVFDEVFAVGCQFGAFPGPTFGIVSEILTKNDGCQILCVYTSTAQISHGSSGGGLFKKHEEHYYLIGVPFRVYVAENGQILPHIARSISLLTANSLIDRNSVTD